MTYQELVVAIKGYMENDFPDTVGNYNSESQIATFVQQAEQRIYNTVQFPSLRRNTLGITTAGNKYLSAPIDFLAVFSLAVIHDNKYTYLLNKDVSFIRESYPEPNSTGLPRYYALFGPSTTNDDPPIVTDNLAFILGPTPDVNYFVEIHYFYYPESIVTADTSWLGTHFDSVLLYGSLLEAYTFMKGEPDMMAQYQKRYDEALSLAIRLGDGMQRQDTYRNGQYRQKVM